MRRVFALAAIMLLVTMPAAQHAQGAPVVVGITFQIYAASYVTLGDYSGIAVQVTNLWPQTMTLEIYTELRSGASIYVTAGTATIAANQTVLVFGIDLQPIPPGIYTATFAAVTIPYNDAASSPTTPVTIIVAK